MVVSEYSGAGAESLVELRRGEGEGGGGEQSEPRSEEERSEATS